MNPIDDPDEVDDTEAHPAGGWGVSEFVKKMAVAGLGALFMTEEGLRSLAGQLKVPKEMLGVILGQAEKAKSDISRVVSEEIRGFLQSEKLREEFLKLLTGMTVEIKAEVRLIPSEKDKEAPKPTLVVSEVGTRRRKPAAKKE